MTTLLAATTAPGDAVCPAVHGAPPDRGTAADRGPEGFFDCRGEWHRLDEED